MLLTAALLPEALSLPNATIAQRDYYVSRYLVYTAGDYTRYKDSAAIHTLLLPVSGVTS